MRFRERHGKPYLTLTVRHQAVPGRDAEGEQRDQKGQKS